MSVIINEAAYDKKVRMNILTRSQAKFNREVVDADQILEVLSSNRNQPFFASLLSAYDTYGKLTEGQCNAVRKIIKTRAEKAAEWKSKEAELNANRNHIGSVGDKLQLKLTLKKVIQIEGAKFSYYDSGINYINILEDSEHNVLIYKGKSLVNVAEGSEITLKFSVKEHGVREGVKQTIIQRPKIVD